MTHPRTAPAPLAAVAGSLGLCLSAAVLAGAPALAAPTSTPAADQPRQQPVVVVMDHSGSMLNADADASGTTRVDAAKAATKDLIQAAPEGAELGLVTFGHRLGTDDFADGDVTGLPQEAGPGFLTTAAQFRERFPDEAAAAPPPGPGPWTPSACSPWPAAPS